MNNNTQEIRESQFILIYGPGSIIESKNGSRLIPDLYYCLSNKEYSKNTLENNEFNDIRMSSVIRSIEKAQEDDIHLFSLPIYSTRNNYHSRVIYNTYIFPTWKICHKSDHDGLGSILFNSAKPGKNKMINRCPLCGKESDTNVRFLLACRNGHLDDINWNYAVHFGSNKKCYSDWFIWKPEGSSPSEIKIQCPTCKTEVSMLDIYGLKFECTGRLPEKQMPFNIKNDVSFPDFNDTDNNEECNLKMCVVQKHSTSLRVANSLTLLRMPKSHDSILKIFLKYKFIKRLLLGGADLNEILEYIDDYSKNDASKIRNYFNKEGNDFESFKKSYFESIKESNFSDALIDEFKTLMINEIISTENFDKGVFKEYSLKLPNKEFPIKICPINKLKTVTAQLSYHRKPRVKLDPSGNLLNKKVSSGHRIGGEIWYPAYEGVGEGIFISSDFNPIEYLNLQDKFDKWNPIIQKIDTGGRDEIKKPLFVWWHTLSHALINSLSLSCGYNSTSLRERIYINENNAGILIYNTSPGEDSGMGGLVDLVDSFDSVLENAINNLEFCSNDPLCYEEKIQENKVNGAACHNCLLISETSCEHRNTLLDRHFIID